MLFFFSAKVVFSTTEMLMTAPPGHTGHPIISKWSQQRRLGVRGEATPPTPCSRLQNSPADSTAPGLQSRLGQASPPSESCGVTAG